jgi:hypothetical protein
VRSDVGSPRTIRFGRCRRAWHPSQRSERAPVKGASIPRAFPAVEARRAEPVGAREADAASGKVCFATAILCARPLCETGGGISAILALMATPTIDELLAAIRQLPLSERRTLIARATRDADQDTPRPPPARQPASLLGLMADEPEVVDEMCSVVYEARQTARMRTLDE